MSACGDKLNSYLFSLSIIGFPNVFRPLFRNSIFRLFLKTFISCMFLNNPYKIARNISVCVHSLVIMFIHRRLIGVELNRKIVIID